jgi:hypothetical protein
MVERVPGIVLDGTEGSMNRLADSICLIKLIPRHNDPADDFSHQVVQVGHQFKDGVTFVLYAAFTKQDGTWGQLQIRNAGTF